MRKLIGSIVILLAIVVALLCFVLGKDTVGNIAGSALDAAKAELTAQIEKKLDEIKVNVVEVKAVTGKLNDEGGKLQFYCAALIRTDSTDSAQDCADALGKLFGKTGYVKQEGPSVESDRLVHKSITYKHKDFSDGDYYTVYVYVSSVDQIVDLDALAAKLKDTISTIG